MLDAHPYEEPAYDIIPLDNADNYSGSGAVGNIKPTTMGGFIDLLKATFNCKAIRYCGDERKTITRVALCGGSGAFLTSDAIASGADIYVTGDVKYHDFTSFADKSRLPTSDTTKVSSAQKHIPGNSGKEVPRLDNQRRRNRYQYNKIHIIWQLKRKQQQQKDCR